MVISSIRLAQALRIGYNIVRKISESRKFMKHFMLLIVYIYGDLFRR